MPYKKVYYTIKCPKCGNEYQVLPQAYFRKQKDPKYGSLCKSCRAKVQWEEMSDEEKKTMSQKSQDARENYNNNLSESEKQALIEKRKEGVKQYWSKLTDEQRKEISDKRSKDRKDFLSTLSEEDMKLIGSKISDTKNKNNSSMTLEELAERKSKKQEERKRYWESLPADKKERIIQTLKENNVQVIGNMSDEERRKRSELMTQRNHAFWNNAPPDIINNRKTKLIQNGEIYRNNMTDDDKRLLSEKQKQYWANLSESEKLSKSSQQSKRQKQYWKSLPREKKIDIRRKTISSSQGNNKFHQKFEKVFLQSILSTRYYMKREEVLSNNSIIHSWDYGIYDKDNNLVMVVDLDGSYFHADNCDYDGLHSKEEYDEKRFLSIPDGVKYHIINESSISSAFNNMIKLLMTDYQEFIDNQFKICRSMLFPYPKYTDDELIRSWNQLLKMDCNDKYHKDISLNTRVGDRLIQHFHPSIYQAYRRGCVSPYEAWYNDELLRKVIENRVIYVNELNPNKILQGFNVSKVAPKVSVFSAGRAKLLISRYLDEFDEIFDPFSGFSGRMLGCVSLGKRYIGQDISTMHVKESNDIIKFLNMEDSSCVENKDILQSYGEHECLFTCPPYEDKELWDDMGLNIKSCDNWIDICLSHFNCKRYLFVVDYTEKYANNVINEIQNKSHFGGNNEYIVMI